MDNRFPLEGNNANMALRDYLRVLFRQKAIVATSVITIMACLFLALQLKTPQYESSVKILISAEKQIDSPYYRELGISIKDEVTPTQSEIVNSTPVIERAVKALKLDERPLDYEKEFASPVKRAFIDMRTRLLMKNIALIPEDQRKNYMLSMAVEALRHKIKVKPVTDTNIFTISVKDYSPEGASTLANILSRSYVIFDLEQQLAEMQLKYGEKHLSVLQLRDNIDKMTTSLNGQYMPDVEAIGPASVKIIEQARPPLKPVGPEPVLVLMIGLAFSVFIGGILAFGIEYLDETFRSPADIERFLNIPYLGSIPKKRQTKAFQVISDRIYLIMKDKNLKTLVIGSKADKDAATSIVVNLGTYLSGARLHNTLIIDANFRNPGMHKYLKFNESPGLAEVLEGKVSLDKAVKPHGRNLSVLVAGKTVINAATLLSSSMMQDLIKEVKQEYDIVLIDAPIFDDSRDGEMVASYADAVSVVVNEGKTRRQAVKAAIEPLFSNHSNVIGAILNDRTFAIPKAIYDMT